MNESGPDLSAYENVINSVIPIIPNVELTTTEGQGTDRKFNTEGGFKQMGENPHPQADEFEKIDELEIPEAEDLKPTEPIVAPTDSVPLESEVPPGEIPTGSTVPEATPEATSKPVNEIDGQPITG